MRRLVFMLMALAPLVRAQAVRSWFVDGTGVEIYSEATGSTQSTPGAISRQGDIGVTLDKVTRMVTDKYNNPVFAYDVEAKRSAVPGAVTIRIFPFSWSLIRGGGNVPQRILPTVATAREFPSVGIGEAVTIDILFNPATGEKIYDVIRPITDPSPQKGRVVTSAPRREQLSLKEISLRVNGKPVDAPASWMLGSVARIDVPGHGMFVISVSDPSNPLFHAAAWAERDALNWVLDGERVDITSKTSILAHSEGTVVWIYHDPRFRSADLPDSVRLQAADSVDWLLPKK
jgi:hypothetical protein